MRSGWRPTGCRGRRSCVFLLWRAVTAGSVGTAAAAAAGGDWTLEQLSQSVDVNLRHLQRFVLGQLLVVVKRRDDAAQLVKRVVQPVHAPPLARVGSHAPLLLDPVDWFGGRGSLSRGCVDLGSGDGAFQTAQVSDFERRRGRALGGFPVAGRTGMRLGVWRAIIWKKKKKKRPPKFKKLAKLGHVLLHFCLKINNVITVENLLGLPVASNESLTVVGAGARAGRVLQVVTGSGVCCAGAGRLRESQPGAWVAAAVHESEPGQEVRLLQLLLLSGALLVLLRLEESHPPRVFAPLFHTSDIHVPRNAPQMYSLKVDGGGKTKARTALCECNSRVRDSFSGVSRRRVGLKSGTRLGAPLLALVAC